ncbi:MAG: N-acyl homoserine lactonase family protein [Pseudomonadota bacterium]
MTDWRELLSEPGPVRLYAMETGKIHMSGNIHFNHRDPRFKSLPKDNRFNPVFSFLVDHPSAGLMVLDTGLHADFAQRKTGNFGWLLGGIVKTQVGPGRSSAEQIQALGADLNDVRHIFLSHLHLDHPSGLPAFRGNRRVKVHVDPAELAEARGAMSLFKGYIKSHLSGFDLEPIRYPERKAPFDRVWDFLGDGSVWILATPGHTPGHASVLARTVGGPVLLTFDAAHRRDNIDLGVPPKGDWRQGRETVAAIAAFLKDHPQVKPVFGHDPDQLASLALAPELLR